MDQEWSQQSIPQVCVYMPNDLIFCSPWNCNSEYDVQSLSRTKRLNLTQQRDSVHLSLSSPYFVRRHPVKSPQRTPSKSVQCGLDRRQLHRSESVDSLSLASSQATLPNTKFMTLQLPSKDKAKGGKKKKSAKREEVKETDKDKEKKQLKKTNSESAILIKLSSKGIRITSHEESFLWKDNKSINGLGLAEKKSAVSESGVRDSCREM